MVVFLAVLAVGFLVGLVLPPQRWGRLLVVGLSFFGAIGQRISL